MPITQYNSSVRQMSQSKFESMKNASGKIPDLANQIVMTNSEDSNISYLRTEVVYDMTSSDASKNWGYPNGIKNNVTVTGKDFSKYDKLIAYCYANYYIYPVEIDLTKSTSENFYLGRLCIGKGMSMLYFAGGETNLEKTSFKARIFRVNPTTDMSTEYDEDLFYVYKIEGVLKTPSMIYTGDELIAGNGISIANGVISRIPLYKGSITQAFNTQQTTTSSTQIANASFNKVLNNSSIVVNYSCPLINNSGGYGTFIFLKIDGQDQGTRCLRNSSGMFCLNTIISNISAGSHTIEFWYGCGGGSASIPAYEQMTATIMEVL